MALSALVGSSSLTVEGMASVAYGRSARFGDGFLPSPLDLLRGKVLNSLSAYGVFSLTTSFLSSRCWWEHE